MGHTGLTEPAIDCYTPTVLRRSIPGPLGSVLLAAVLLACGGAAPRRAPAIVPQRPPVGDLTSLAPPDCTLVVVLEPARLFESPQTAEVLHAMFSDAQLDRFQARTGVDPRTLAQVVLMIHPDGRLAIARGPIDARFAVLEAGERMAPVESAVDEPVVRRAGFLGASRVEIAALEGDTLLVVDGPPLLSAEVFAAAERPEAQRAHVLAGVELGDASSAPLLIVAPRPLGLPIDTGIGMLLAEQETLRVSAREVQGGLQISAEFTGEFPTGSEENFRAFAESVARTEFGRVLGVHEALPTLEVTAREAAVSLTFVIAPATLARGVRAVLFAQLEELIDGEPPSAADDMADPARAREERGDR